MVTVVFFLIVVVVVVALVSFEHERTAASEGREERLGRVDRREVDVLGAAGKESVCRVGLIWSVGHVGLAFERIRAFLLARAILLPMLSVAARALGFQGARTVRRFPWFGSVELLVRGFVLVVFGTLSAFLWVSRDVGPPGLAV